MQDINFVPGRAHPQYGFHPDIMEVQTELIRLVHTGTRHIEYKSLEDLPEVDHEQNLLLIGGPISNRASRAWRGFVFDRAASTLVGPVHNKHGLRWDFHYPPMAYSATTNREQMFKRYVGGRLVSTVPKFIVDRSGAGIVRERCAAVDPGTGMISSDVLLVTYIPNVLTPQSAGKIIIDIADLHGQGDKGFATILGNDELRQELFDATRKKRFRFFQALYEIPVKHDNDLKHTQAGIPQLIDVFQLS